MAVRARIVDGRYVSYRFLFFPFFFFFLSSFFLCLPLGWLANGVDKTGLGVVWLGFDRRRRWRLVSTAAEGTRRKRRGSIDCGSCTGRQGGSAQVGGAAGRPTDFGHYTIGCCRLSLPGLPIGRRYAVVHCRHRWTRRGYWGKSIHPSHVRPIDNNNNNKIHFFFIFFV